MEYSQEQTRAFEESFDKFRQAYADGKNKVVSLEDITDCRIRCATLIEPVLEQAVEKSSQTSEELKKTGITYFQELPNFTLDCHRYLTADKLPEDINQRSLDEQQRAVISPEELVVYDRILREQIERESAFLIEIKGMSFGGDGLVVQVWYEHQRMQDFNDKLGERVRKEVPSMDFQWGIVKNKIPIRVVNIARFIGDENRDEVIKVVDKNQNREFGYFRIGYADLVLSDHYIQRKNTKMLGRYNFKN